MSGAEIAVYVTVFVTAAVPWLEILLVIPAGILVGAHPVTVAVLAFAGNAATVVAVAWWGDTLRAWWRRRRDVEQKPSRRASRGRRIAHRYGLPGLALISPIITGSHVAVLIALSMGAGARETAGWVCLSLVVWTVVITIATLGGLELVPVDRLPRLALP